MTIFKAHVRDGRLTLDEPTDLPEGQAVYLQAVDAGPSTDDGLSEDEREDLFQALDEAIESVRPPEDADGDGSSELPQEQAVEPPSSP